MSDGGKHCAMVPIINKRGLHARASAKIVEASARFQSHITVSKDGQTVDGRSIMGLMMLAASFGSKVEICAEGPDAVEALRAMQALAEAKFGEE
ncbi:MAG TPA: HPr family phosphocarrier protein [Rhizomicrobium sp.]|nr:HPr family phosphocarrier protein [Rhizomicrobium sp.]